jgi:hypothetical protein
MADFERLIAAGGELVAVTPNNRAKVDANLNKIREEILAKIVTNHNEWKPTKKHGCQGRSK